MKISVENYKANGESLNQQNLQMTLKPMPTSGRSKVTSSIAITMILEFSSSCRGKKTFTIAQKYIDATRSTRTDLDVMQEKRVDNYWNVD